MSSSGDRAAKRGGAGSRLPDERQPWLSCFQVCSARPDAGREIGIEIGQAVGTGRRGHHQRMRGSPRLVFLADQSLRNTVIHTEETRRNLHYKPWTQRPQPSQGPKTSRAARPWHAMVPTYNILKQCCSIARLASRTMVSLNYLGAKWFTGTGSGNSGKLRRASAHSRDSRWGGGRVGLCGGFCAVRSRARTSFRDGLSFDWRLVPATLPVVALAFGDPPVFKAFGPTPRGRSTSASLPSPSALLDPQAQCASFRVPRS